jgi:hypothetical protein
MRSPYDEHLLAVTDLIIARFGTPATQPDWEPLNLATLPPLTPATISLTLSLPESYLHSLIRLEQLPKLATANLLPHFTSRFVAVCTPAQNATARTTLGNNPKVSIEFALAQLCMAHLHFHACAFLLKTSLCVDSHICTMDNMLLFLDRFLDRCGNRVEKQDGWAVVHKCCSSALNILRKDWQSGA